MDLSRYFSQMAIPEIGVKGQQLIAAAKVLVIGAGGLGCPVLSYLAGAGIGTIGVIDDDRVEAKNLHRQVLYAEADISQLKAVAAKKKLTELNSTIVVHAYPERLTPDNAGILIPAYDIVVDCCDNIRTRYIAGEATRQYNKPFVYGAVRHLQGQMSVFNYQEGPSFTDLFPDKTIFDNEQDCAAAGITGCTAGLVGCLQASEVLKIVTGMATILSGEVLTIDLAAMHFRKLKIRWQPAINNSSRRR